MEPLTVSKSDHIKSTELTYLMPGAQTITVLSDLIIERAEGSEVWDINGKRYIDFFSGVGVCSIGHNNPHFVDKVSTQLRRNIVGSFFSQVRAEYLQLLANQLPPTLNKIQFYTTGSEAVEAALKLAKAVTGKFEVLSFWGGFHGKTLGSLSLHGGSRKSGFGPLVPGTHQAPYAYCYRCPIKLDYPTCNLQCVGLINEHLGNNSCGSLAAIIVEPVQGTNGNVVPPIEFLQEVAKVAKENQALLIFDEVITGFGRTGKMFGFESIKGVVPDILILGKGMASGVPVSAIVYKESLLRDNAYSQLSAAASTFGGNSLSCSAALATLEVILQDQLLNNVRHLETIFHERSRLWLTKYPFVGTIHVCGLMLGIELVKNSVSKEFVDQGTSRALFSRLLEKGLLSMSYEPKIRFYPALSITPELFEEGLSIVESVFDEFVSEV